MEQNPQLQEHHPKGDVREFADDVKAFWDRFGLVVLLVVLASLVALLLSRYLSGREVRERETAYAALSVAESPFAMEDVAERYSHVPGFAGYARLHAADLRLREAMGLMPGLGTDGKLGEKERSKALEQTAELYQRVIDAKASDLHVFNARLGLASILETQGAFDKAREQYEVVKKDAAAPWPAIAGRAEARLKTLDEIATPVSFPAPKPKEEKKEEAAAPTEAKETPVPAAQAPAEPKAAE